MLLPPEVTLLPAASGVDLARPLLLNAPSGDCPMCLPAHIAYLVLCYAPSNRAVASFPYIQAALTETQFANIEH